MKNNKGFVELYLSFFCIAGIIVIFLFLEYMVKFVEHENDDELYEEVLK